MENQEKIKLPGQAFAVGDRVYKPKGYKYPGEVVAAFTTLRGEWRYVVECTVEEVGGMLHIYNASQLCAAEAGESTIPAEVRQEINKTQGDLRACEYKLRNKIGSEEAAKAGIEAAVARLRELEKLL